LPLVRRGLGLARARSASVQGAGLLGAPRAAISTTAQTHKLLLLEILLSSYAGVPVHDDEGL
jgi:hypothetical protein